VRREFGQRDARTDFFGGWTLSDFKGRVYGEARLFLLTRRSLRLTALMVDTLSSTGRAAGMKNKDKIREDDHDREPRSLGPDSDGLGRFACFS
jgi:hypothetical protein